MIPSTSEITMFENTTDGILKWDKHRASGERLGWKVVIPPQSLGRNFPRWVTLAEAHLELSFRLLPVGSDSRSLYFLAGSLPTRSVTPWNLSCAQMGFDVSTYQAIFSLSQKNARLLNVISIKGKCTNHERWRKCISESLRDLPKVIGAAERRAEA